MKGAMADIMLDLVHSEKYPFGVPYKKGGADPTGIDCYGLIRWCARIARGIELPEKPIGWRRHVEILPPETPIERCDVICFCTGASEVVTHIGMAISRTDFIHADHRFGAVVCEPILRYREKIRAVARFKLDT